MADIALPLTCFGGGIRGVLWPVSIQQEAGQRAGALVRHLTNNVTCAQGDVAGEQLHFCLHCLVNSQPIGFRVTYLWIISHGSHLVQQTIFASLLPFKQWPDEPFSLGWGFFWSSSASLSPLKHPELAHLGFWSSLTFWWPWHLWGGSFHSGEMSHRTNWHLEVLRVAGTG